MNLIERLRKPADGQRYNVVNGLLKEAADAIDSLNKEVKDLRDEVVAGDQDIEHLTEVLEHLIAGAVACVEIVVQNERLFSENKMLDYKLKEEKKKTAELTADLKSRARCMKYWQELYSKCNKDLYELEQKKLKPTHMDKFK